MSKTIETDLKTFTKFWLVPLGIGIAILIIYKALTGLIIIGISIFLALALRPLVRRVNNFFIKQTNNLSWLYLKSNTFVVYLSICLQRYYFYFIPPNSLAIFFTECSSHALIALSHQSCYTDRPRGGYTVDHQ